MRPMIRRWSWLVMLAALSGPTLRLAEAADDLAHAMPPRPIASAEPTDGGVGDDSGLAPLKTPLTIERALEGACADHGATAVFDPLARVVPKTFGSPDGRDPDRPPDTSRRRQARLQILRY